MRYYVDVMTEEQDGFEGFGVFDNKTGFCKANYFEVSEANDYCNILNS